jgi:membrane protease YdiL (CAAX protease family)
MKQGIFLFAALLAINGAALAQSGDAANYNEKETLSRAEVLGAVGVSAAFQAAGVLESFGYDEPWYPYAFLATDTLQLLPSWYLGTKDALANTVTQVSADALCWGNYALFGENFLNPLLFNFAHKYSMFATYDQYLDLRGRCDDAAYANSATACNFLDLATAPYSPQTLSKWYVWGNIAGLACYEIVKVCASDQSSAVWTTGKAYIGSREFPVWAAASIVLVAQVANFTMTGLGEESLYRGVYYEELKQDLGIWPARIIDATYFTVSHYPQQYESLAAKDAPDVLLNFALSCGQALWFQLAYEWGGLRAAVAAHTWSDIVLFLGDWLLSAGAPYADDSGFSVNARNVSLAYEIKY